jgi:hypothetical protein
MVEPDRAHDGDVAGDQVGGVPRTTHAHLEHGELHRLVGEPQESERSERLEVRRASDAPVDRLEDRQQVLVLLGELALRERLAADLDPFGH